MGALVSSLALMLAHSIALGTSVLSPSHIKLLGCQSDRGLLSVYFIHLQFHGEKQ